MPPQRHTPGNGARLLAEGRFQYVPVAGHAKRTDGGTIAGAFGD